MAIDALGYAVARIKERSSDIFVGIGNFASPISPELDGDDHLYSLGAVRNITVAGNPVETSADSHGRTYQKGVELEITWEVMQTDYAVEMTELPDLVEADNVMLKVTDALVTAATGADATETALNLSTAAHAASGIEFDNVSMLLGFNLDGDGGDSVFNLTVRATLTLAQVKALGTTPVALGG